MSSSRQVVKIRASRMELVATPDTRAETSQACDPGFVPTILEQSSGGELNIDVPTEYLFVPRDRILIRRGTDEALSATDGSSDVDITRIRSRYGVLYRSREEEAIYQNATVDLTLYGCFSPYSFLITGGRIAVDGRAEAYAIQLDETLQSLGSDHDPHLSVWYATHLEALRIGGGKAYNPFPNSRVSSSDLAEIGQVTLTSEAIPWEFAPVDGDGQSLLGGIMLSYTATVIDGGVFSIDTATE